MQAYTIYTSERKQGPILRPPGHYSQEIKLSISREWPWNMTHMPSEKKKTCVNLDCITGLPRYTNDHRIHRFLERVYTGDNLIVMVINIQIKLGLNVHF